MSYENWIILKNSAETVCSAAQKSVTFSETTSVQFGESEEYNRALSSELDKIFQFIQSHQLTQQVDEPGLIARQNNAGGVRGGFGTGLSGIGKKFSAIQILCLKIDRIYNQELKFVDKAEHTISLLNRKLFLLEYMRTQWSTAFNDHSEVKLEQLGGLHFFECGLWGFKVRGPRSETDLIFRNEIGPLVEPTPFIMTEWKKATDTAAVQDLVDAAIRQCEIYNQGIAKPLQVTDHRFIIIVSRRPLDINREVMSQNKKYLIRNIAIERPNPAAEARLATN